MENVENFRWTVGHVAIPLGILIVATMCKSITRGGKPKLDDFAVGMELSLIALAAAIIHILDLTYICEECSTPNRSGEIRDSTFALVGVVLAAFVVLLAQTHWDRRKEFGRWKAGKSLLAFVISMTIGAGSLGGILWFVDECGCEPPSKTESGGDPEPIIHERPDILSVPKE